MSIQEDKTETPVNNRSLVAYRKSESGLISGIILMHWSQLMAFSLGRTVGLVSLFCGFLLIVGACVWRAHLRPKGMTRIVIALHYAALLMAMSVVLEHEFISSPLQITFHLVVISLLVCGFVMGATRFQAPQRNESGIYTVLAAIVMCLSVVFARQLQTMKFDSARGLGSDNLNAVGVAYVSMCLVLTFLILAIKSKSPLSRILCIGAAASTLIVVLGTASRGAVLWGGLVCLLLLVVQRTSIGQIHRLLGVATGIVIVGLVVAYTAREYPVVEKRIGVLKERFTSMMEDVRGEEIQDLSIKIRVKRWRQYLDTAEDWWLLGARRHQHSPHNQWMEILVRFGMLGVPFLIFSVWSAGKAIQHLIRGGPRLSREELLVYTLFLFGYLQSLSSLTLHVNRVLFLGFGYILGQHAPKRNGIKHPV